jgi:choline dehydrogenase-like flavoprotein
MQIPTLMDLPVGKNLQDHVSVYLNPIFINQPRAILIDRDLSPRVYMDWFGSGKGILTSSGVHASALISSSIAKSSGLGDWPDIQLLVSGISVSKTFAAEMSKAFGLKYDEMNEYYQHAINKDSFTIIVSGARPLSRGSIKLGGNSPHDSPIIDPNYLSDENNTDVKVMIEGIKTALYMAENTTTFGELLGARFTEEVLPGCEGVPFRSDEYWECYIRRYTVTLHHACGTASMGKSTSPHAVVDSKLKVLGTKGLRVIDLSVMPVIITTNSKL